MDLDSEDDDHDEILAVLEESGSDYEANELKNDMKIQLLDEESPKKNINTKKNRKSKKHNFEEIVALTLKSRQNNANLRHTCNFESHPR